MFTDMNRKNKKRVVTTYIIYGSNRANIEKSNKKHNLVTTEKSVERLAAASDSHVALQAAANPTPLR